MAEALSGKYDTLHYGIISSVDIVISSEVNTQKTI